MTSFHVLQNELVARGAEQHASELHGLLVGYACGVGKSSASQRQAVYESWLGAAVAEVLTKLLDEAYEDAVQNLDEFADFGFRLLMPDDESPIEERVSALGLWCAGFLSGLGESGRSLDTLTDDVAEALNDLGRIAAMTDEVPEGEENEEDLAEIEEFVRVSVLLVFADVQQPATH